MVFTADKMRELSESVSPNFEREVARAERSIRATAKDGKRFADIGFDDVRARDAASKYLSARGFTVEGFIVTAAARIGVVYHLEVTW